MSSQNSSFNVSVTKHNGLGNDFLVLDQRETSALSNAQVAEIDWPNMARNWCNRKTGIGADGLLLLGHTDANTLTMRLYNSDGSLAEMSGNGIRCLAQAAHMADDLKTEAIYSVDTDAGERRVVVTPQANDSQTVDASVDMGPIGTLLEPTGWATLECDPMRPVMHISVGNPHSVVGVEDVAIVPLKELGEKVPQINLEIIEPGPEVNAITMRVHERGAGITQACGTGACASAWAAVQWGLVPKSASEVIVHMDGGDVKVRVNEPKSGSVTLIGPAQFMSKHVVEISL
ncbi:MAG: diaminopimelate epimerase [Acidimicrobiia bacterium]